MIGRAALTEALTRGAGAAVLKKLLLAETPGNDNSREKQFPHVHPDQSLHIALERMGAGGLHVLPVVSRASVQQLLGIVVLDDVLQAYGVGAGGPT
jgi:CBS domain-containing protein